MGAASQRRETIGDIGPIPALGHFLFRKGTPASGNICTDACMHESDLVYRDRLGQYAFANLILIFVSGKLTPPGELAADETYCSPWNIQRATTPDGVRTSRRNGSTTSRPGGQAVTPRSPTAESMDFPEMHFSTGNTISREAEATGLWKYHVFVRRVQAASWRFSSMGAFRSAYRRE